MKKLGLMLESIEVESFSTADPAPERLGTVCANQVSGLPCDLTRNGCPTQYCATVPLLCATVFAPQCTGTTCTG